MTPGTALPSPDGERPADALLEASGIAKRYGAVQALDDVHIDVRRGEVVALAGENGSGKSTLAGILAGALRPDAGEIVFGGSPVSFTRPREALEAGIALVAQEPTAVPDMSIAENVLLTRLQRPGQRVRPRSLAAQAAPLLESVGLDVDPHRRFSSLGPGDRELAEVAKALASEPRLLILDEATARLPDAERLLSLVDRLRGEGMSAIFITHRLPEIRRIADRAVVLRDGNHVGELARTELSDDEVSAMMVGRELGELHRPPATTGDVVLSVDGVTTDRSDEPVSLEVRAGEVVGLAGLVGSGRSELLEAIAGFRRRGRGEVVVGGRRVTPSSTRAALRAGLSLLPEDRHRAGLVMTATLRENVCLPALRAVSLVDARAEREQADRAVTELGIRCEGTEARVRTLSGGNQQKVVIGRCLALGPSVLLLDEPTRGVDVGARAELYRIIGGMVEEGMAVLMASSDLVELLALSDRIVVLHEGAVAGELDRSEATEQRIALLSAGGGGIADVA